MQRGRLHALIEGEDLLLLPIGAARFRLAASPHVRIEFKEKDGSITGFEIADGGAPVDRYRLLDEKRPSRDPGVAASAH
jgi:hypothetical protein